MLGHIGRDLRDACLAVARLPVLAAVVVLSLGAGIGVNTVVFSWIQVRVFKPLPGVARGAEFLLIEPRTDAGIYPGASWPEYRDLTERLTSFKDVLAFRMLPLYVGDSGNVERLYGLLVSDNYFSALGVRPALGRLPDEISGRRGDSPAADASIVVISHGLWQTRFSGSADALGRAVRVNGRDFTIVAVTPRQFQGTVMGLDFDVWLPAPLAPIVRNASRELTDRSVRGYTLMGRLRAGATRARAQAELDASMAQLATAFPATNATLRGEVLPFWQSPRGPQRMLTTALVVLQAIMLLLLLAVCGNMANLVLARASVRRKEMGVRLALGAAPWRIASLLLAETVLLAAAGAGLGAAVAVWGTQALQVLPLTGLPLRFQTSVDPAGLAFAMLLGVGCGLIVGAAPALLFARADPQQVLRAGSTAAGRSRIRNLLMAAQVALALMVLIVAGLFFRGFMETRNTDPGFRRGGVLLAAYNLQGRNASQEFARAFAGRLLDRLRALPAVDGAAIASSVPLDIHGLPSRIFTLEGRARDDGGSDQALANTVTPGYFSVMGIPFSAGRDFAGLDDTAAPPQAIVNEEFARRYVGGHDPTTTVLGRRLQARGGIFSIIGVVRNSLYNAFGEPPTPIIYLSYRDGAPPFGDVHLRTRSGSETALANDIRRAVQNIDPELPVFNVRTLTDHVETNLVFRRVPARMFAVLGPLLLVLAAIGIYAVVEYSVSQRTSEIGIRLALGATAPRVVAALVSETLALILVGAGAGWVLVFAVYRDFAGTVSRDSSVFAAVPVLLLAVATLACWLPAKRAASLDPVVALRQE
ncbi:MAG TPA: ABC transporter permease [Vicinamibacterales bacterium]|nr:ABC transporter permease [Vicinamibacterales bacterium]